MTPVKNGLSLVSVWENKECNNSECYVTVLLCDVSHFLWATLWLTGRITCGVPAVFGLYVTYCLCCVFAHYRPTDSCKEKPT